MSIRGESERKAKRRQEREREIQIRKTRREEVRKSEARQKKVRWGNDRWRQTEENQGTRVKREIRQISKIYWINTACEKKRQRPGRKEWR